MTMAPHAAGAYLRVAAVTAAADMRSMNRISQDLRVSFGSGALDDTQ